MLLAKNKAYKADFWLKKGQKSNQWALHRQKNQPNNTNKGSGVSWVRGHLQGLNFASGCKFCTYREGVTFLHKRVKLGENFGHFLLVKRESGGIFHGLPNRGQYFEKFCHFSLQSTKLVKKKFQFEQH